MRMSNEKICEFETRIATRHQEKTEYPEGMAGLASLNEFFQEYVWRYQAKAFQDGFECGFAKALEIQRQDTQQQKRKRR